MSSILGGRLAATEGAFFLQESKNAVGRLTRKLPSSLPKPDASHVPPLQPAPDVLPEILRHSLPLNGTAVEADPSLLTGSKWQPSSSSLTSSSSSVISPDVLNPLRAYVSLPQATFGPKRWQLPNEHPTFSASKANELRHDTYSPIDSEKLKALAIGYSQIVKAFAIATGIVFGGGTVVFAYMAHKLHMESADDIRTKGKDLIQPGADMLKEQMAPLRAWAENVSRKWHIEGAERGKGNSVIKEFSKTFGARSSN